MSRDGLGVSVAKPALREESDSQGGAAFWREELCGLFCAWGPTGDGERETCMRGTLAWAARSLGAKSGPQIREEEDRKQQEVAPIGAGQGGQ